MTADRIFGFFQSYCDYIHSVGIETMGGLRFAIVTFNTYDRAVKAAKNSYYIIDGVRMDVSVAEYLQRDINILDLNDESLSIIYKHLDMKDSYSLSKTCQRLDSLLHKKFAALYENIHVTLSQADHMVLDIIREYGQQMKSIRLRRSLRSSSRSLTGTRILTELMLHCGILTTLEMVDYTFGHLGPNTATLNPLFARLHTLKLKKCRVSDRLFPHFDVEQMVLMEVEAMEDNGKAQPMRRLKSLKIIEKPHVSSSHRFLRLIREQSPVEHLEIDEIPIGKYDSWNHEINFHKILKTLKSYCRINMTHTELESTVSIIGEFPLLTDFVLGYPITLTPFSLLHLIKAGHNLDRLVVILNYKCTKDFQTDPSPSGFEQLVDAVAERPNKKRLNIIIVGSLNQITPFMFQCPAEAPLKITCLLAHKVADILEVDQEDFIRMSEKQIATLQNEKLLP